MRTKYFIILLCYTGFTTAQENKPHVPVEKHHITLKPKDTLCRKDCFLIAHWEAHSRSFFMSTHNQHGLRDDYALATGAGIGLLTRPIYGFQAGVSGFFIYNLASSSLYAKDSIHGLSNRYELGLFDLENPGNRRDLDRLEELYIKYNYKKSSVSVGKMHMNTPFINLQDGRMRPTLTEGAWLTIHETETIGFNGGWIWDISPRSTVHWYRVGESMGINPVGINTNGTSAQYKNNIETAGMAIANVYYNPRKNFKINAWNSYLENVMNTVLIEINTFQITKRSVQVYQGFMYIHQNALNNGGNINQDKTYIDKGAQSNVISAQLGIRNQKFNTSVNYTHISKHGRYLMPREWGREPFYTFLPRERNEGLGHVNAFAVKSTASLLNNKFKTGIGYGFFHIPDVQNFKLNKYGLPSYHHLNIDASYTLENFLKGLEIRLLAAYKLKHGETYDNIKFTHNKVNMINLNLTIDFRI